MSRLEAALAKAAESTALVTAAARAMSPLERALYYAHRREVQAGNRARAMDCGTILVPAPGVNGSYGPWVRDSEAENRQSVDGLVGRRKRVHQLGPQSAANARHNRELRKRG